MAETLSNQRLFIFSTTIIIPEMCIKVKFQNLSNFDLWYTKRIKIKGVNCMPRRENQKKKLLALREIFLEQTDENHYLTMSEIMRHLETYNISAERKSIYDDFEILREFGIEIESKREGSMTSYHIANRLFDLRELKMLIDVVQSSKFITEEQSRDLTNKIKTLCSRHDAGQLFRRVTMNRVKSANDSVLRNIDKIHQAMHNDRKISFVYYEYNIEKERIPKKNKRYNTSPYALILVDGYYYMLGYKKFFNITYHYRVDKMAKIRITDVPREGKDWFKNHNLEQYTRFLFSMFDGDEEKVTIHFAMKHIGAVIDRFGKDVMMKKVDNDWFEVTERIKISPPFYAWVLSFGAEARVVAPEKAKSDMAEYLMDIAKLY